MVAGVVEQLRAESRAYQRLAGGARGLRWGLAFIDRLEAAVLDGYFTAEEEAVTLDTSRAMRERLAAFKRSGGGLSGG